MLPMAAASPSPPQTQKVVPGTTFFISRLKRLDGAFHPHRKTGVPEHRPVQVFYELVVAAAGGERVLPRPRARSHFRKRFGYVIQSANETPHHSKTPTRLFQKILGPFQNAPGSRRTKTYRCRNSAIWPPSTLQSSRRVGFFRPRRWQSSQSVGIFL